MKRNLYFYLYPVKNSIWRWHVEKLAENVAAFNGRRIIVLSLDGRTDSRSDVLQALGGIPTEMITIDNDPSLWEVKSFVSGLTSLRSSLPDEITFYAHGKGVSYDYAPKIQSVRRWCEAMYFMNLSSPDLIERLMAKHSAVGCFRMRGAHAGSQWHFSGTFFWFKHSAVFSRNWKDIYPGRYGVEGTSGAISRSKSPSA